MVTSMLEKAIEIEGLLRIIRDGDPLPETYNLLMDKAESLASEAKTIAEQSEPKVPEEEPSQIEPPQADFVMAAPEATHEQSTVDFTIPEEPKEQPLTLQSESVEEEEADEEGATEIDLYMEDEDDIILTFDDVTDPNLSTEEIAYSSTLEESTSEAPGQESPKDEAANTEKSNPEEENTAPKRQVKLRSVFSLNDRFLYARELFNGNMKMFDSTLDRLEDIQDFSVIEDYFYNDLEWNQEDANVVAFMERLKGIF